MTKKYKDMGDALDNAIDHVAHEGWATHDMDVNLADDRYKEWREGTGHLWVGGARRDREPLFDAILTDMCAYHGESQGTYYAMLLMLMMEVRARRDGLNDRGLTQ